MTSRLHFYKHACELAEKEACTATNQACQARQLSSAHEFMSLLSCPPRSSTACTKCACSVDVQRIRGALMLRLGPSLEMKRERRLDMLLGLSTCPPCGCACGVPPPELELVESPVVALQVSQS